MMAKYKIKKSNKPLVLALLALLGGGPAPARAEAPALPDPGQLLDSVLNPPQVSYEGRMMVTHWFGRQTRAEEVRIYHKPPDKTRREFLNPDGSVSRITVSDGNREEVHLLKQRKIVQGDAVKIYDKLMSPETERKLLFKNYRLSVLKRDQVAGRSAWVLEMAPLAPGKPFQRLWIDEETRVVLENKRFIPRKPFAALSRFNRFEPRQGLDDGLFKLELASGAAVAGKGLEPDFMSLDELKTATGNSANFPDALPGGFVFESADFLVVGKSTVRQARYTDGLAVVSLFATDRPVRLPKKGILAAAPAAAKGARTLRLSSSGEVLSWKRGRQHYTLIGDLSRDSLESMASGLK